MLKQRRFWLGLVVSLAFLYLFLQRVDFAATGRALAQASYIYLIPAVAVYFGAVWFRALRWRFLLQPLKETSTRRLYPVVVIGYMANNLLPVRLGELVRAYFLGTKENISKTAALATIAVERVFDGIVLLFFLAAVTPFISLGSFLNAFAGGSGIPAGWFVALLVAPFAVVLTALLVVAASPKVRQKLVGLARRLPARVADRAAGLVDLFIAGLAVLRSPWRLLGIFVLSLPVWLAEAAMYLLIGYSFGLEASLGYPLALVVFLLVTAAANLALIVPSSQGGVGPFEWATKTALVFFGVADASATAYAIVLHAALLIPVIAMGLLFLWTENLSLADLTRERLTLKGAQSQAALPRKDAPDEVQP
ncbi:MAG: lysylphosphatidylglycerol synthase transmembrane domain-containing protein [Dehalococcoidia bacterium]|nr:lysylphosphatidylglycerol synthase transmembrane domain-containing protein [Dehalococcoidia bacterium]